MVEVMKATGKPTAMTMSIGLTGDTNHVTPGECAVRLARAGTVKQLLFKHICMFALLS